MRVFLPNSETPAPTWRDRVPTPSWRWTGPLCVVAALVWLLGQTGVTEIAPDPKHPPLRLAHPKPGVADWPGWRGPTHQGIVDDAATPPSYWSPSGSAVWRSDVPGIGNSSPCVWGDDVYVTTLLPETRALSLLKYNRETGRLAWQTELRRGTFAPRVADAISTPATDGQLVYVSVVDEGQVWLCAVYVDGKLQWKRAAGPYAGNRPYRSSPVVWGSCVYVAVDHRGSHIDRWKSSSTLAAFHRQTGEIVWRVLRPNSDSAGVPVVAEIAGRRQLILAGGGAIASYDPETGTQLWKCRWTADRVTGSVAYDSTSIYARARHPDTETLCVKADGSGDVTNSHIVWRERRSATEGPSPIVVGPALLLLSDQGLLTALDKGTGRQLWQRKLTGQFEVSPVAVKHRLYCTNRDGVTFIVDADRRGDLIAENPVGQPVAASIAVSGQRLIFRGEHQLLMIGPQQSDTYAAEPASAPRKF